MYSTAKGDVEFNLKSWQLIKEFEFQTHVFYTQKKHFNKKQKTTYFKINLNEFGELGVNCCSRMI